MSRFGFSLVAALALAASPVAAQEAQSPNADIDAINAELSGQFLVEPLTAEQEARLPLARTLVAQTLPEGGMAEIYGGMITGILGPFLQVDAEDAAKVVSNRFGYNATVSDEDALEAAAILDPAWNERLKREMDFAMMAMDRAVAAMEPFMRDAMAQLYAMHFTEDELAGISAFVATPIGTAYIQKSYAISSDPRLPAMLRQGMPQAVAGLGILDDEIAAATADLTPERGYSDLNSEERKRLAELTGMSIEELAYYLDPATAAEEEILEGE